jgi:hypothetical protein
MDKKRMNGPWPSMSGTFSQYRNAILIGVVFLWALYGVLMYLSYRAVGTLSNSMICMPLMLIITTGAFVLLLIEYKDHKRIEKERPKLSGLLIGSAVLLFLSWFLFILIKFFLGPPADEDYVAMMDFMCIPTLVIITILTVMFIVYERKKPWRERVYPGDELDETSFFEPAMIIDSPTTRDLRLAIVTLIGLIITIVIIVASIPDSEHSYSDTDPKIVFIAFFLFFVVVPVLMALIIGLFWFYVRSKYRDWEAYKEELRQRRENIPYNLNAPESENAKVINFGWKERMERRRFK